MGSAGQPQRQLICNPNASFKTQSKGPGSLQVNRKWISNARSDESKPRYNKKKTFKLLLIVSSARPLQARIINTLTRVSAKPELNSGPLIPWFLLGNRKRAFSCLFLFYPPSTPTSTYGGELPSSLGSPPAGVIGRTL